jgi:hypothetical protein
VRSAGRRSRALFSRFPFDVANKAFRSLVVMGLPLALGSDGPVDPS